MKEYRYSEKVRRPRNARSHRSVIASSLAEAEEIRQAKEAEDQSFYEQEEEIRRKGADEYRKDYWLSVEEDMRADMDAFDDDMDVMRMDWND